MLGTQQPSSFSTSVMVVPASSVIFLKELWPLPRVQQEIHLMLFPPGERLTQKLPGFVQVEISGSQEAQHMLILWNLHTKRHGSKSFRWKMLLSADECLFSVCNQQYVCQEKSCIYCVSRSKAEISLRWESRNIKYKKLMCLFVCIWPCPCGFPGATGAVG